MQNKKNPVKSLSPRRPPPASSSPPSPRSSSSPSNPLFRNPNPHRRPTPPADLAVRHLLFSGHVNAETHHASTISGSILFLPGRNTRVYSLDPIQPPSRLLRTGSRSPIAATLPGTSPPPVLPHATEWSHRGFYLQRRRSTPVPSPPRPPPDRRFLRPSEPPPVGSERPPGHDYPPAWSGCPPHHHCLSRLVTAAPPDAPSFFYRQRVSPRTLCARANRAWRLRHRLFRPDPCLIGTSPARAPASFPPLRSAARPTQSPSISPLCTDLKQWYLARSSNHSILRDQASTARLSEHRSGLGSTSLLRTDLRAEKS